MIKPTIHRKRYIPYEVIDISSDELLKRDEDIIITRWNPIKPRKDIKKGVSYTFLKEGYKISRFYDTNGDFSYWYCDIIDIKYNQDSDTYELVDLLLDVRINKDWSLRVLDANELAEALENKIISIDEVCKALKTLDKILTMVYEENFPPIVCRDDYYWGI